MSFSMHSPMQSCGESRMQPSTPCSASMECGGSRSIFGMSAVADDFRRGFFKSSDVVPDSGLTESIMVAIGNYFPGGLSPFSCAHSIRTFLTISTTKVAGASGAARSASPVCSDSCEWQSFSQREKIIQPGVAPIPRGAAPGRSAVGPYPERVESVFISPTPNHP